MHSDWLLIKDRPSVFQEGKAVRTWEVKIGSKFLRNIKECQNRNCNPLRK
jgi:hypothetical protein